MKKLRHILIVVLCIGISASAEAQFRRTVNGNGKVVEKERKAIQATTIKVSSEIDVYLSQGDEFKLSVEADENLHDYILTEKNGDELHVYTKANIRNAECKKVYVTLKEINSVSCSSAGDLIGETAIKSDNLRLSASSAGDIKLEVYAKTIDINISSSGDITLSGDADSMEANLSSAGDLNAYNLTVKEAEVSASSAGDADIYVTERLVARSSSAGDINYKGDPKYIDAHSSSAGGVHRK